MFEIWDERQIQILVLLSFTLQVFLFFTGGIRCRSTNPFLRFLLWIAYLGADSVAVYTLGLLARQQDVASSGGRLTTIQPLAFLWAPFLLIHLGGQDTVTAFVLEDNNLWLRHFLNLVVQVGLTLYVFWKSTIWRNVHFLVTGILLFLAGMIKYRERTMALKYGNIKSLESYTIDDNKLTEHTSKADVAVTYTLFVGGICLEVCAAFMMVMSVWTWKWLVDHKYCRLLAPVSWWLVSSRIALPEERSLWSNSTGQYDFLSYAGVYEANSKTWKQQVLKIIRQMVKFAGVGRGTLFWFSKFVDTTKVPIDKDIMELFSEGVRRCTREPFKEEALPALIIPTVKEDTFVRDFGTRVIELHISTELYLRKFLSSCASSSTNTDESIAEEKNRIDTTVKVCRKLSTYMLYLLVTHPEMLPANGSIESLLESCPQDCIISNLIDGKKFSAKGGLSEHNWKVRLTIKRLINEESLEQIKQIWIRLFIYVASKSQPELHAAHLAKGGELLTFIWLLLLHHGVGDLGLTRIEAHGDYAPGIQRLFRKPREQPFVAPMPPNWEPVPKTACESP